MTITKRNTTLVVLFYSMLLYAHDRVVIRRFMSEGRVPYQQLATPWWLSQEDEMTDTLCVLGVDEDGSLQFQNGIHVDDQEWQMRRVRQIRDVLDNSVQRLYGKDSEVQQWADDLGGLRKVQEKLIGLSLGPKGWYKRTLAVLKDNLGYEVPPLGDPIQEVPIEGATSHSPYAVEIHRLMVDRKAHGEFVDDDDTLPSWAASDHDFDLSSKPWWWKWVYLGKFRDNVRAREGMQFKQTDERHGTTWIPDLRISECIGSRRFKRIVDIAPWWRMQDHPQVKEFMDRFYNDPNSLMKQRVGMDPKTRWAFGMECQTGILWAPVTYKSDKVIRNFTGPRKPLWRRRSLYLGRFVFPYWKSGEGEITCQKLSQDLQTGLWVHHVKGVGKKFTPQEWSQKKREIIKAGGKDAYFGYPWKEYVAPPKSEYQ